MIVDRVVSRTGTGGPSPGQAADPPPRSAPLSLAYVVGAWPPDAEANGVLMYVRDIMEGLRQSNHHVSIMTIACNFINHDNNIYHLGDNSHRGFVAGLVDKVAFRVRPARALARRVSRSIAAATRCAIGEHGLQLLEMEEAFGWPCLVKRQTSIPLVVRLHGPWFINGPLRGAHEDASFRARVRAEREAVLAADAVSAPSRDILDRTRDYYGLPLESAVVIPNPGPVVPPERRWRPMDCDPSLVLFVGRFDLHKGGDIMIDAFVEVLRARPDTRLWFVGPDEGVTGADGHRWDIRSYLAARALRAWSEGRIEWLGRRPGSSLAQLRRRAAVTVVASRYDNFPTTVLEAMAHGCPLVATRTGGIPEMVQDGAEGLLCPPNDPLALAASIRRLLDDPSLAARLGAQAASHCQRAYHPTTVARTMAEYYRSALDRVGPRAPRGC